MGITPPIFKMFGSSPVSPLQHHMQKAYECCQLLLVFFAATFQEDWETANQKQLEIAHLEHEADEIKKQLRLNLPYSLLMPVSRGDLLEILTAQDCLANQAEDISGLIIGRRMLIPNALQAPFITFLGRCINAAEQADNAINNLGKLFETGFHGNIVNLINDMIIKLNEIEQDTDQQQVAIRKQLFALESELPPIDTIFLYKIIQWTGEIADYSQSIGGRLQLLLAS